MINPNNYNLIVCVNDQIDDSVAQKINKSVESIPEALIVRTHSSGAEASFLLLGISYCAVKICEGFLSKIGEMVAEKT